MIFREIYTSKAFNAKKVEIINGSSVRTQFGLNVKLAAEVEKSIDDLKFEETIKAYVHAPREVIKHVKSRLTNWQNLLQVSKDINVKVDMNIAALYSDKKLLAEKEKELPQARKLIEIFAEANLHVESLISTPLGILDTDSIQMRVDLLNYYLDESLWFDGVVLCQDNQDFIRELIWASSGFSGRGDNNEQDDMMLVEQLGEDESDPMEELEERKRMRPLSRTTNIQ